MWLVGRFCPLSGIKVSEHNISIVKEKKEGSLRPLSGIKVSEPLYIMSTIIPYTTYSFGCF